MYEETGALKFEIERVFIYEVTGTFGMVYFADIEKFGELPESEIESVKLSESLDLNWTYPQIQPFLMDYFINLFRNDEQLFEVIV